MKDKINFNISGIQTPCYVVDEGILEDNLKILKRISERSHARILLAQKAFSMFSLYPLVGKYLHGTTASSLFEAMLGKNEMGGETHIFSPAYAANEFENIMEICEHIVFSSFEQWHKYRQAVMNHPKKISCGIRLNPEYSEQDTEIYDPCARFSRMGVTIANFENYINEANNLDGIEGFHFHTMCEQNSDTLKNTLDVVIEKFGKYLALPQIKWLNMGGGHHITREDYDRELLIECIQRVKRDYDVEVYLEPGEAVALNAGFLVTEVMEIMHNEMPLGILDASAACHMPDVIEMPYRPRIIDPRTMGYAKEPGVLPYTIRFGGNTCLAGDIIGDYSFEKPLKVGDKLIFCDMAIYSMVKNNTFNGVNLPSIGIVRRNGKSGKNGKNVENDKCEKNGEVEIIKKFGYEDFKNRLS